MTRLAHTIPQAVELSSLGRTTLYEAIKTGALPVIRHGRRVLIADDTLRRYLKAHETTAPARAK
jgi:excisionase family DNA binding protein